MTGSAAGGGIRRREAPARTSPDARPAAKISSVEYKRTLEAMADNWAGLAADRKAQVMRGKQARRAAPENMLSEAGQ